MLENAMPISEYWVGMIACMPLREGSIRLRKQHRVNTCLEVRPMAGRARE